MAEDLSRWIQETVYSSYLEECQIFNELDASYGLDFHFSPEFPGAELPARKRKLCSKANEDNSVSAGKQARSSWRCLRGRGFIFWKRKQSGPCILRERSVGERVDKYFQCVETSQAEQSVTQKAF